MVRSRWCGSNCIMNVRETLGYRYDMAYDVAYDGYDGRHARLLAVRTSS